MWAGLSLRETALRARLAAWADVSDVALLKRLRNSESWSRALCAHLLAESGFGAPASDAPKIRVADATIVREPGKTGSQWRILYAIRLPDLECDFFELTSAEGAGNGETLARIPAQRGELILGDAGYSGLPGLLAMKRKGADVLIRINPANFQAWDAAKRRFSLLQRVGKITRAGKVREWKVWLRGKQWGRSGGPIVRYSQKRTGHPSGGAAATAQSFQKTKYAEAGDTGICPLRHGIHHL